MLCLESLNESPSEKEGKYGAKNWVVEKLKALNESPSEKEGKFDFFKNIQDWNCDPSMKVPPKRKGNSRRGRFEDRVWRPQ